MFSQGRCSLFNISCVTTRKSYASRYQKYSLIFNDNQRRTHHIVGVRQILLERSIDLVGAEAGGHEGVVGTVSVRRELGLDGGNQGRVGDSAGKRLFDGGDRIGWSWSDGGRRVGADAAIGGSSVRMLAAAALADQRGAAAGGGTGFGSANGRDERGGGLTDDALLGNGPRGYLG